MHQMAVDPADRKLCRPDGAAAGERIALSPFRVHDQLVGEPDALEQVPEVVDGALKPNVADEDSP